MMAAWLRRAAVCALAVLMLGLVGRWWMDRQPPRPASQPAAAAQGALFQTPR